VLLYELLTGKTPFDKKELLQAGLDAMRRTILEKEPERPSTKLSTMIGGELTITAGLRHTEAPKLVSSVRGDQFGCLGVNWSVRCAVTWTGS